MDCFNRLDGPAAAEFYSAPSFVIKNGELIRFGPDEKVAYFSALMESNGAEGEHTWEIADFKVVTPASNGALVTVRWVGRRPDSSVIWDFSDTYVLGSSEDGWLILGDIVHDRP